MAFIKRMDGDDDDKFGWHVQNDSAEVKGGRWRGRKKWRVGDQVWVDAPPVGKKGFGEIKRVPAEPLEPGNYYDVQMADQNSADAFQLVMYRELYPPQPKDKLEKVAAKVEKPKRNYREEPQVDAGDIIHHDMARNTDEVNCPECIAMIRRGDVVCSALIGVAYDGISAIDTD